ncbi:alpha/beta hydrolase family protein [Photobacterium aquae]|uniref:alpha/beta hydrolase family protein n=1 Tax=Photobacterium aquae TaxID=1195763 RepID=UPI00069FF309|nr:alpha/beta fold hydrolase [Photobacterium aquae]
MPGEFVELKVDEQTTIAKIYQKGGGKPCSLVIAIHGDCPTGPASYQNTFARMIADNANHVIAVGLLRPGYKDGQGHKSSGRRGFTVGDNYDRKRIQQLANAIELLKQRFNPAKVIIAGHSGGAAITGKLIAYYPDIAHSAIIVSCPSDINPWRRDMLRYLKYPLFWGKLKRTSPIELTQYISDRTDIHVICGSDDPVTKPYLSVNYVNKLKEHNKTVKYDEITGDHDIFLNEFVISSVLQKIEQNE